MKVLHIALGCFFIDNYGYQENLLPKYNKLDGHDVKIIASTLTFADNKNLKYTKPSRYLNENNIEVVRLDYKKYLPLFIMDKFRHFKNLASEIKNFEPDVIFVHGFQSISMLTVIKYIKSSSSCSLYVDSHADFYTSGTNILSRILLHRILYRNILNRCKKYIKELYYISKGCGLFLEKMYNTRNIDLEYLPLGGEVMDDFTLSRIRINIRNQLGFNSNHIVFCQAGKIDEKKKLLESLEVFTKTVDDRFRYVIVGSIKDSILNKVNNIISSDSRITYLGWKNYEDLKKHIIASDVYIQPGKVSALAQTAITSFVPVILRDLVDYRDLVEGNGWLVNEMAELSNVFKEISLSFNPTDMREASKLITEKFLDYKIQSKKYLS